MVQALPYDGPRNEVISGTLYVTPAPTLIHQRAVGKLYRRLDEYLSGSGLGCAFCSPADITFSPQTLVQPDLFVLPGVEGRPPRQWSDVSRLLLAVEVRSPSTAARDRGVKRRLYQRESVPEYWIVDCDARCVERWRPGDEVPESFMDRITWHPEAAATPLVIPLPPFFDSLTHL